MNRRPLGLVAAGLMGVLLGPVSSAAAQDARVDFTFSDPAINESSGLVARKAEVLTVNDSGDGPTIYVVDSSTGETVGHTTYTSDAVVDVEALAPGPDGTVWVGDIGDNDGVRDSVRIYRLDGVARGDATVVAPSFDLVFPGGGRDAETLLVHPRTARVFVVSKGLFGGQIFRAPKQLSADVPNRLKAVGKVGGLITDGTFLPGGRRVVLRDYGVGHVYDPKTWTKVGRFGLPSQPQAEAVAWRRRDDRLLTSTEGANQPVYAVRIPARLTARERPADETSRSGGVGDGRADGSGRSEDDDSILPADLTSTEALVPVVAGGGLLVVLTLLSFGVLRSRVRRR